MWLQPGWLDFLAWATVSIRRVRRDPEPRTISGLAPATPAGHMDAEAYEACSRAVMHGRATKHITEENSWRV